MKPFFLKKHRMTLIELIVSMGLIMLMLTTLAYFYGQVGKLGADAELIQRANFQLRHLETRLQKILPKAISESDVTDSPFLFFTSNDLGGLLAQNTPSLVLICQNGVSLEPQLANEVLTRLYLDKEKRLCVAMWPSPNRWEVGKPIKLQKEVLMENVAGLNFSFYVVPERNRSIIENAAKRGSSAIVEPDRQGEWVSEWKREYNHLPAMVKVSIQQTMPGKKDPEELILVFVLHNSQKLVVYE